MHDFDQSAGFEKWSTKNLRRVNHNYSNDYPLKSWVMRREPLVKSILSTVFLFFSATAIATETLQQIDMQTVGLNTFYVSSTIEGAGETSLLVDTGSGYSIINQDTLERLQEAGDAIYLRKLEGVMADGSHRIVSMYRISGMTIGNTCHVRNIEVVVFPSGTRQILGLSTLSKVAPFTFSMNPPKLSLSHCDNA